jgi:guanylate kinase
MKNCIILVGPVGTSKESIAKTLVSFYPELFSKTIRATTRQKETYEKNGIDYHFISPEEFHFSNNPKYEFIEVAKIHGYNYGTLLSDFTNCKTENLICILEPKSINFLLKELEENPSLDFKPFIIFLNFKKEKRIEKILSYGKTCPEALNIIKNCTVLENINKYKNQWKNKLIIKEHSEYIYEDIYDFIYGERLISSRSPGLTRKIIENPFCKVVKTHYNEIIFKLQGPLRNIYIKDNN